MKPVRFIAAFAAIVAAFPLRAADPAPNGITLPAGDKDWKVIAPSHRTDNNTLRVIVGNEIAVSAARAGKTNPWPEGSVLGKLVWRDTTHATWPTAQVPGDFVHAEFMVKDTKKYAATGAGDSRAGSAWRRRPMARTPISCRNASAATPR